MNIHRVGSLLLGCLCLGVGTVPAPAPAQESVRVVETLAEATGDRHRYVVRDLEEDEIRAVQRGLREAGLVGIGWTGRLDDGTRAGLRRFQAERGLVECGCVSYETVVALGLLPEVVATISTPDGVPTSRHLVDLNDYGWIYAVPIPVLVPRPCPGGACDGALPVPPGGPGASPGGGDATGTAPGTAAPPGVRTAPPSEPRRIPPPSRRRD